MNKNYLIQYIIALMVVFFAFFYFLNRNQVLTMTGIEVINKNVVNVNNNLLNSNNMSKTKIDSINMKIDFMIDQIYYMKDDFDTLKRSTKRIYNYQKLNQKYLENMNNRINQRP